MKMEQKKKEKDPNKPKRPQSAYFLWLGENRFDTIINAIISLLYRYYSGYSCYD